MRWLVLLLALLCSCDKAPAPRHNDVVALDQLPPAVLKAAQAKLPEVKFETAWKTESGEYEVRGKAKTGKIHDVKVSEAGDVLETD